MDVGAKEVGQQGSGQWMGARRSVAEFGRHMKNRGGGEKVIERMRPHS
jgi:hypothetical protein